MTPQELRARTMAQSLDIFKLIRPLMRDDCARHVGRQLFRAATAVAANYRAVCLARSPKEFVAKIGIVREEADEVVFWLEFGRLSALISGVAAAEALAESREVAAITAASYETAKKRLAAKKRAKKNVKSSNSITQ